MKYLTYNKKFEEAESNYNFFVTGQKKAQDSIYEAQQIKNWFDASVLTCMWASPDAKLFPAHMWQHTERQRRFAFSEGIRYCREIKNFKAKIWHLKFNPLVWIGCWLRGILVRFKIAELKEAIHHNRLEVKDQAEKVNMYTRIIDELVAKNNNKPFQYEQYEEEHPRWMKWYFGRAIVNKLTSMKSGIDLGIIEMLDTAGRKSLFSEENAPVPKMVSPLYGIDRVAVIKAAFPDADAKKILQEWQCVIQQELSELEVLEDKSPALIPAKG